MSFDYHKVTAADAAWARPILLAADKVSCEYTFANIFMWSHIYHTRLTLHDGLVIVRYEDPEQKEDSPYSYLFPAGEGDIASALEEIIRETTDAGKKFQIFSISEKEKQWMENTFPGRFDYVMSRDEADYLYESAALRELKGKKLQKKRNHVSRFIRENPDYQVEELNGQNLEEVMAFNNQWANLYDNRGDEGIAEEHKAVELVLRHYRELGLSGCLLRVKGKIAAFSYGSPVSNRVFDVHVEKALYDVTGAYNMINREFARRFCENYEYINREDDVGSEGLREAKLSYHPTFLEYKYIATLKGMKTKWFI
ncbi:MAG: phosphatidylglycerol lysyltransferase domain-containing protein [Oscillospiraceae bacterium]|nr:phosphatidylglycerol lysyltransferase domain-containing protein [Oscillospiraceae bacterium]